MVWLGRGHYLDWSGMVSWRIFSNGHWTLLALGVGLILIGLNIARAGMDVKISKFNLFIGIIAFAIGGAGILGYTLPFIPTIVILIGLFIMIETIQKLTK